MSSRASSCLLIPSWPPALRDAPGSRGKRISHDAGAGCGEWVRVHLFVMTLGFSRRILVAAFLDETRCSWQAGLERAFLHFGGVT